MTTTTAVPIPLDDIRNRFDGDVVYNDRDFLDAMQAHFPSTDPRVIAVVACAANQDGQGGVDGIYRYLENGFHNEAAFLRDFEKHYPATEGDRAEWENTTLIALPDSECGHVWVFDSGERMWDRIASYRRQQEGRELREVASRVIGKKFFIRSAGFDIAKPRKVREIESIGQARDRAAHSTEDRP